VQWSQISAGTWSYAYEGVSKSFRTCRPERELQMVQLSSTRYSSIVILLVSLVSFAAVTLWKGQKRVIPQVSLYFVIDSVRKRLDTPLHHKHVYTRQISDFQLQYIHYIFVEPGKLNRYSDWLRAGRSDDWGSIPAGYWEFFSSTSNPDRLWGSPCLLPNGYGGLFPLGVKRPGSEADHSPPSSTEVKNAWSYTSTPQHVFIA
jgi:hypothetical protein